MKKFLRQTSLFLAIFLGFIVMIFVISGYLINRPANFQMPAEKKYVIFGHSHTANAFNDSIMPEVLNLAESMEGYLYTYGKIRKIVSANKGIRAIFLEVTNNQFGYYAESRLWGEYMPLVYPKHFPTMDLRSHILLLKKEPMKSANALPVAMKLNLEYLFSNENYIQFQWSNDRIPDTSIYVEKEVPKTVYASASGIIREQYGVCNENLWYLAKITWYCSQNGVKLYFIRSPLAGHVSKNAADSRFTEILRNEFQDIPFLDFAYYPVDKSDYYDEAHLNKKGSLRFSGMFYQLIQNGLLEEKDMQKRIDSEIQAITTKVASKENRK